MLMLNKLHGRDFHNNLLLNLLFQHKTMSVQIDASHILYLFLLMALYLKFQDGLPPPLNRQQTVLIL